MPSNQQIEKFLNTHGQKAGRIVTVLAKRAKFMQAIKTELGQELMIDALEEMEGLLDKIVMERANKEEKADFRALRRIVGRWQDKIAAYNKAVFKIETNQTKE